jgi:Na+-transporting methylmalonyl-CoA/oxaloacetate decarboxylase gamma subunit
MGLGTVFVGLICLIFICYIMGFLCNLFAKKPSEVKETAQPVNNGPIANKQEIVAAACAVIAEELGTEANNIKVISFKRV